MGSLSCSLKIFHHHLLLSYPYLPYLTLLRALLWAHADSLTPTPEESTPDTPPALAPGDSVLLKELYPETLQPKWTGPYTLVLTTPTATKLIGYHPWAHISKLKRAPSQDVWTTQPLGPTQIQLSHHPPPPGPIS